MKYLPSLAIGAFAFTLFLTTGSAQTAPPQENTSLLDSVAKLDAPLSEQLGFPKWLSLGGQYRSRFEDDTALGFVPGASDAYYLQRVRVNLTVRPTAWLRFTGEFQDSHNFLYGSRALPANTSDPFDMHQAFVEIGSPEGTGFSLKAGRQEMPFGSQRLIGSGDWLNSGRAYDVLRGTYNNVVAGMKIDVVAGSMVLIDPNRFDRHMPGEHFYMAYGTAKKWIPKASVEPYYILKTTWNTKGELGHLGDTFLSTVGLRVIGVAPGRIDYSAEIAKQMGHYATDPIRAVAGAYILGWQVAKIDMKPRFSVEYDHSSGDSHAKDGVRQTFDSLYSGHGYYGFADQVGWKNIHVARVGFDFSVTKKLQFRIDGLDDNLATTQDALYNIGGVVKVLNRKATSTHVGNELDFLATYQMAKNMQFKVGFSHLFAGAYLKQSTKGSGYSSPLVMWTKNF